MIKRKSHHANGGRFLNSGFSGVIWNILIDKQFENLSVYYRYFYSDVYRDYVCSIKHNIFDMNNDKEDIKYD